MPGFVRGYFCINCQRLVLLINLKPSLFSHSKHIDDPSRTKNPSIRIINVLGVIKKTRLNTNEKNKSLTTDTKVASYEASYKDPLIRKIGL